MTTRDAAMGAVLPAAFAELADSRRWVTWREEGRDGRRTKVPYSPVTGRHASTTNPTTWATLEEARVHAEQAEMDGVGIVLGDGLGGVDLDACRDPETGDLSTWAQKIVHGFGTYAEVSPSGTGVKLYAYGAPEELPASRIPMDTAPINGKDPAVEVYTRRRYFCVTGRTLPGASDEIRDCGDLGDAWDRMIRLLRERAGPPATNGDSPSPTASEGLPEDVEGMLKVLDADCSHDEWLRVGMALHHADPEAGIELWDRWSATAPQRYPGPEEIRRRWASFGTERNRLVTVGSLLHMARERGYKPPKRKDQEAGYSHDALALELGERWADEARHVAAWGRWFFFDGTRWREDDILEHMTRTRQFLRDLAVALPRDKRAEGRRLRRAETVAKVVGLARSNEAQAAGVNIWDKDPWLLGTPKGTVDLRTGELMEARPGDYITKTAAVAPAPPGSDAPLWRDHLERITGGDPELIGYLRRFFGYALTGSIREHAFAFGHGTGANGKGVTLNTIQGVMGDYAVSIPTEMLMVSQSDRHPTELARLRGVRLAIGQEVEDGRRWAESKIKSLTGGDPIAARFMRMDFFEFEPQFKLFVVGNKRPSLRGVDEAMRRRLHMVPFEVTIPEGERDPHLPEKLREEWPAILRWAVEGCLEWRREGLHPPSVIQEATRHYLDAEDALSIWVEECCEEDPNAWETTGTLYASWKRWADDAGEFTGSQKRLKQALEDRGYRWHRKPTGRGFYGLRVQDTGSPEPWDS